MSCSSPTNFDDFESLFADHDEGLESLYQSPTGASMASSNSSGTDHSSSNQQQQARQDPITYDVLSDGYAFGLNEFDLSLQSLPAQKQKTGDLAAANPFFSQATNAFNPLTGFVYPATTTTTNGNVATTNPTKNAFGATTAFNPQFPMNQLGMYFPQAFPFPQFGGQPFPSCFPNTLAFSSPNISPIMPVTLNTSPINNTTTTSQNNNTTNSIENGKTKTARRKTSNTKKNTKSSTSNNNNNNTQTSSTDSSDSKATTSPSDSVTQTATTTANSATSPESIESTALSHSSDNDSASSSGKKSSSDNEKKRKRKTKGSPATNSTPEKALTPEEEKEMKRQRRLIKNRESAQASRERKKVYIQGLEKKVDGLAQENSELHNHCSALEQENEILRQRLKMLGEVVEEPSTKKRKMSPFAMKVPIPSNPFMLDFWSLFGMGAMQQQQAQANPAMDVNTMRMDPRASTSSRRVVMFIMLFCVAMFLVFPRSSDVKFDSNMKPEMSVDEATANRMRVASRTILSSEPAEKDTSMIDVSIEPTQSIVVDDEFKKNVADIYNSFSELRQAAASESVKQEDGEESTTPVTAQERAEMDLASQINVVFDSDKISLTFPKSILVKNEEADDAMVDETQSSNATTDGKISLLSTKLLREICRVVRQ